MVVKNGKIDLPPEGRDYIAKIGIFSDMHIGYDSWNDYSDLDTLVNLMNEQAVDFVVIMGDCLDSGYSTTEELMTEQLEIFNEYMAKLTRPLFRMKGNHDADVSEFTEFGIIQYNGLSIICIFPKYVGMNPPYNDLPTPWSNGRLTEADISWISDALDNTDESDQILFSHYCCHVYNGTAEHHWGSFNYPICDTVSANTNPSTLNGNTYDGHRDDLVALCSSHSVNLFVSGHEHVDGLVHGVVDNTSMTNVQMTTTTHRKIDVLTVYSDRYYFEQIDMDGTISETLTINKTA